ncbi:hypothetical protein POVCU2_0042920 [Plasmodium ovale curtisi]|uniref:Uncharacterized protein n=1 Tax=Plasmodium ovale curtisi TaxID=864141 RepID=A0A1A8X1Q3_PLAOA|nr:hypothetical protein POVCU2_0042920 [Plasmodium ovale curtisi]SBS97627.1 hypothetical protein POVCU1_039620 [Plasmodium ovale curtisi]
MPFNGTRKKCDTGESGKSINNVCTFLKKKNDALVTVDRRQGDWGRSKLTPWVKSLGVETHIFKNARAYNSANRTC